MAPGLPGYLRRGQREAPPIQKVARGLAPLAAVLLVSLGWRVPSLFDPPWVNDEGTYFAVAQAMAHGERLYSQIWENKPPAIYLLYLAVLHAGGPSLLAIRIVTDLTVLALVCVVWRLGHEWGEPASALLSAMLCGLLFGVPVLEGTTGNAEVFVALFVALGVYLCLRRGLPVVAGVCIGLAILFKAVAAFDGAALGIWLILHHRRYLPSYIGGAILPLLLTLLLAARAGILSGLAHDAFLYDLGYVGHANGGGIPWLLGLKLLALCSGTVILRRAPFPYLWLLWSFAGALFSGRLFGHYLLQPAVPLCLCIGRLCGAPATARRATVLLPAVCLGAGLVSACMGALMVSLGHDTILAQRLQYYPNFARFATGQESSTAFRAHIDDHVNRNLRVARVVRRAQPGTLLVWGNTPWIYVLSHRLPSTPYTSALRTPRVPGETASLRRAVLGAHPAVVVVIGPPQPRMGRTIVHSLRAHYARIAVVGNAVVYERSRKRNRSAFAKVKASARSGTR